MCLLLRAVLGFTSSTPNNIANQQLLSSAMVKAGDLESSDLAVNFGKALNLTEAQFAHIKMQETMSTS